MGAARIELSKLPELAAPGHQPETDATVAQLMYRYAEVADCDLSTRKASEVYIRRVIKPALGTCRSAPYGTPARFAQCAAEALSRPYVHR